MLHKINRSTIDIKEYFMKVIYHDVHNASVKLEYLFMFLVYVKELFNKKTPALKHKFNEAENLLKNCFIGRICNVFTITVRDDFVQLVLGEIKNDNILPKKNTRTLKLPQATKKVARKNGSKQTVSSIFKLVIVWCSSV